MMTGFGALHRLVSPPVLLAVILAASVGMAAGLGLKSGFSRLYELTDSRGRVVKADFAYYPDDPELRVRVTLAGGRQANGSYRDPDRIRTLLLVLRGDPTRLSCVFDSRENRILALYRE